MHGRLLRRLPPPPPSPPSRLSGAEPVVVRVVTAALATTEWPARPLVAGQSRVRDPSGVEAAAVRALLLCISPGKGPSSVRRGYRRLPYKNPRLC
jgi:hypothetical protein